MKKLMSVAALFFGVAFCHADGLITSSTPYENFFVKPKVKLSIAVSADGKNVIFYLQNNTKRDIKIAPFRFLDNYLLIKDCSGRISRDIMFRKGKYHLITIAPGKLKTIRKIPLSELISNHAGKGGKGEMELIWFFDMSRRNVTSKEDNRTFFKSNRLIIYIH